MKIINIKKIEDCFDGSFIKEALFDNVVTKNFIYYLALAGELEYFPSFARPFYKVEVPGRYMVKGVEGNKTARLIITRKNREELQKNFIEYVTGYNKKVNYQIIVKGNQHGATTNRVF
jgi:hypothetical protein